MSERTEQQIQEELAKYERQTGYRQLKGWLFWLVTLGLFSFTVFQLYTSIFGQLTAYLQRSIHLAFALGLIFLLYPARRRRKGGGRSRFQIPWYDGVLCVLGVAVGLYWLFQIEELVQRVGRYTPLDLTVGTLAVLFVLEAVRRVLGLPLTIIASAALVYAYFGPYMPGFLEHRGIGFERLVSTMYFSTEGILGTPLGVSATFIFLYMLFGAFLERTGVGQYFNDLAMALTGRSAGGPAKVAVFSSALQGTVSGSSVANVVTSGVFTIPMMKRLGYDKNFAGAVEATSSTGGQLMPPIMGAAAFLMAEFLGISYAEIAKAALIPAILYFVGIWVMVHFEAKRIGLRGLGREELPPLGEVLKKLYLLLPIVAIAVFLMMGFSATRAALFGILTAIAVGWLRKETRMGPVSILMAMVDGARSALSVAAATAAAGIVVGVITTTGLGLKLGNALLDLANNNVLLTLFFTMITAIIIGMGSPTTANYVITSTIAAPVIILLGYPDLSAHMFAFYFGIVADITPPVALAAFAAAGLSGGSPIRTGLQATRLALAAFLLPYIFVLSPALLLIDVTALEVLWVSFTSIVGMIILGAGAIGYWMRPLWVWERLLAIGGGVMLVFPEVISDIVGLSLFALLLAMQYLLKRPKPASRLSQEA